jgi:cytidylate kinase
MIVTIDGPAGSGKSSAARGLARRLGIEYLDTGAMFRAVGLAMVRSNVTPGDESALAELLAMLRLEMPPGQILLNGVDVSHAIRTPEAAAGASRVAVSAVVRTFLAEQQRAIAAGRQMVCEGRDQGTVVFPDAAVKFFLIADPAERARRRWHDLVGQNPALTVAEVLAAQEERDRRDATRELAPLRAADDAIVVDTTHLSAEDVLDRLEHEVRSRRG